MKQKKRKSIFETFKECYRCPYFERCKMEVETIERWNEVSTRNKTSQEIIEELKTNMATLQRLGCSGAFFDGYHSAVKDVCRMLEGK